MGNGNGFQEDSPPVQPTLGEQSWGTCIDLDQYMFGHYSQLLPDFEVCGFCIYPLLMVLYVQASYVASTLILSQVIVRYVSPGQGNIALPDHGRTYYDTMVSARSISIYP